MNDTEDYDYAHVRTISLILLLITSFGILLAYLEFTKVILPVFDWPASKFLLIFTMSMTGLAYLYFNCLREQALNKIENHKYDEAFELLRAEQSIRQFFNGASIENAECLILLARVSTSRNNHDDAKKYANQALKLYKHLEFKHRIMNRNSKDFNSIAYRKLFSRKLDVLIAGVNYELAVCSSSIGDREKSIFHIKEGLSKIDDSLKEIINSNNESDKPLSLMPMTAANEKIYYQKKDEQSYLLLRLAGKYLHLREKLDKEEQLHKNQAQVYCQAAINLLQRRIAAGPEDPLDLKRLAECNMELEQYDEAMSNLNRAIEIAISKYQKAMMLLLRAECFMLNNQPQLALEDLSSAINLDVSNAKAYMQRSLVYKHMGSNIKSIEDKTAAMSLGYKL